MTRRASARFTALLTVLALTICATPAWAQTPRAERPAYKVGDKWMRTDGTYELTRIDKDVYVFIAGRGNEVHLSRDLGLAKIVGDGRVTFDVEPAAGLSWPLAIGKWGIKHGVWRLSPPKPTATPLFTGNVTITWKVEGAEDVRVAAGSFRALRISHVIEGGRAPAISGVNFGDFVLWYAPDLGLFVKAQGSLPGMTWELAGLDRPGAPPAIVTPPAPVAPSPAPPAVARPAPVPPATAPPPAVEAAAPHAWYIAAIHRKIKERWDGVALAGQQLAVIFEIGREGDLRRIAIDKSSGNPYYDQAAVRAVTEAHPFPPLPPDFKEPTLSVGLQFAYDPEAATRSPATPPAVASSPAPPAPAAPPAKPRAERPIYAIGDKWIRSDGAYELTRIDRDVYVFTAGAGKEFHLTKDLGVARIVLDGRAVLDIDAPPKLAWPLEVGKWGGGRAALRTPPSRPLGFTGSINVAWRVEAYEDVPSAAGSFKAFRITQTIETAPTSFGSGQQFGLFSLWYAPDVQKFVKAQGNLEGLNWELAGVGAPSPPPVVASPPAPSLEPARETPRPASPPPVAASPADTEAPKIVVNYPAPDTKVEREQIVVLGLVTDNVGVDRVQVTVNGLEVAQPRDIGVSGKGLPIRVPAQLQAGENVIEITATDKAGNVAQVVRTVTRVASTVTAPSAPKVADRWAVVIGVGEYEHEAIPRLRFAARDAQAMYDFLTTRGGYPKQNVLLLTDSTAEKPTLQNIRRALGDFLSRKPGREDMVLIYYAGHGAPEVDAAGTESDGLSKYLIPRNADPDSLYSTAFPMDEIQKIFARIAAERVVMLLDTCYSGTAGGRTFARHQTRAGNVSDQFLERLTRSRGRVVITASGPNEVALESPDLGHGIFTYYLLEGLAGKADRNGDGLVTVSELYEYVEDQVDRKAREAGGRQRPLMKGEIEGTLPLSRTAR